MPTTFRGYEPRTVPTADLKPGDRMYCPGAAMLLPIVELGRDGADVLIWFTYEKWGRLRRGLVRRRAAGKSTIHVPD